MHFLAQVVALPLQLLAQPGVFLKGGAQAALGTVALGDVLQGNVHPPDPAVSASFRARRHQRLDDLSRLGRIISRLVIQIALGDELDDRLLVDTAVFAQEIGDVSAQNVAAPVAHLGEPPIAGVNDAALAVHRVHHRRGASVQAPVLFIDSLCLARFDINHNGLAVVARGYVGETIDPLARCASQVHRYVAQTACPA